MSDSVLWKPRATVIKYQPDTVANLIDRLGHEPSGAELRHLERTEGLQPDDVVTVDGNLLTTAGVTRIMNLFTGGGTAAFTNTLGFVGVGNSLTAAVVGDTALGGNGNSSTAWYRPLDASYPTLSAGTVNANCTFGGTDAIFTWNEWCLGIIASGTVTAANAIASVGTTPIMVNHKIAALGTKPSSAVWTLNGSLTIA